MKTLKQLVAMKVGQMTALAMLTMDGMADVQFVKDRAQVEAIKETLPPTNRLDAMGNPFNLAGYDHLFVYREKGQVVTVFGMVGNGHSPTSIVTKLA